MTLTYASARARCLVFRSLILILRGVIDPVTGVLRLSTSFLRETRGNGETISAASLQGGRANERQMRIITKGNEAGTEAVRSEIVGRHRQPRTRTARGHTWNQDVCRVRETVTAALCRDVEIQYRGSEHTYRLGELGTTCSLQRRGEQTEIPINHPVTSREPRRGLLLRISQ